MPSRLIKIFFVLACLSLVCVPLSAQKGKPGSGGAGGGGCAQVTTPMVSTATASPGINVGVFGRVTNCSGGKKRYTVTVSSMSSCQMETMIASSLISFAGGEAKLISVSYPVAPNTCRGPMTISVKVYDGGSMVASESTGLMIE
jgi:hypothetical protein